MYIYFDREEEIKEEILNNMVKVANLSLLSENVDPKRCEMSVTFVESEDIKQLNNTYRGIDKVTDVLSFPQYESVVDMPKYGEICLGDVVICEERAKEQAKEFGHSYEREIVYLFTHSILHLLGYDHLTHEEKGEMRIKEELIMKEIGLERE